MQITFKTGKGELLFVNVPEGANVWINPYIPNFLHIGDIHGDAYSQNIGNGFGLIGLASEITEEQWQDLLTRKNIYSGLIYFKYFDFINKNFSLNTATESYKSILQHLGIDFDPIVLFKPNNCF